MVLGKQLRIQIEVLELLEKISCPKIGTNVNDILKILALFCLDNPEEFKKWQNPKLKKKK